MDLDIQNFKNTEDENYSNMVALLPYAVVGGIVYNKKQKKENAKQRAIDKANTDKATAENNLRLAKTIEDKKLAQKQLDEANKKLEEANAIPDATTPPPPPPASNKKKLLIYGGLGVVALILVVYLVKKRQ